MTDIPLKFAIDWELEQKEFREAINAMIKDCLENGKVLTLPIVIIQGSAFIEQLSMLLSQIDCKDCNKCCKSGENGVVSLVLPEYKILAEKYGADKFERGADGYDIVYPCRFLKSGKCSIYNERPLVCAMYPFQPGGFAGEGMELNTIAIASSCPEGRRIARAVFMISWRLRRQFKRAVPNL